MHFSLLEKLGGAALIVAWVIYGANFLADSLVHQERHAAVGIAGGAEPAEAAAPAEQAAAPVDFNALLKTADAAAGEKVFGKCKACHTVEKGGANGVGPNLYNVVGGPKAHIPGFSYSSGLKEMAAKGDKWGYEQLNAFLASPKAYVEGTKMSFAGLGKPEDRAAVIAYLRSKSDSPPPLP